MNNLARLISSGVANRFQVQVNDGWAWRTAKQGFIKPEDMVTSHLFYTFRMIWNNTMPSNMRVGAVRMYNFGSFYSDSYMKSAVANIGAELAKRELIPSHLQELQQMYTLLANKYKLPGAQSEQQESESDVEQRQSQAYIQPPKGWAHF